MVNRGGTAAGGKRAPRVSTKPPQEMVTIEDAKEEIRADDKSPNDEKRTVFEKPVDVDVDVDLHLHDGQSNADPKAKGTAPSKKEDYRKNSMDDLETDERLDLDDNEPEYDPEEFDGYDDDDDEKEINQEEVHGLGNEEREEVEEVNEGEDEAGDLADNEIVDSPEEVDSEGDDEHAGEEDDHAETLEVEEEEHHNVVQERRKRKEFEVFIGGLDKDATEEDLREVFGQVGEVTEVRLMTNPQTKKNKGFAFLRFSTVEQAKRAVLELKNPVIKGKECGVTPSQDSDTLFLGNICKTWTKEALSEKLKRYGVENVDDITLVEDSTSAGLNRGFAFLEFSSRSDATAAYNRLQKKNVLFGLDRPAKVSFADSFIDPGDEYMAQVKTVFIDGLLASWDEYFVRELLKRHGKIVKIELARNMPSARRKDFGFVTFDSHDTAVTCAKAINNSDLGQGDDKAKVRARLSRPLQRGIKGRNSSRLDRRHGIRRAGRSSRTRPASNSCASRVARKFGSRVPPPRMKRPARLRRPIMSVPARARPLSPPSRPYNRRPPVVPPYPRTGSKRDYGRREVLPPSRSRAAVDYSSRAPLERRPSYRDEYSSRSFGFCDLPRASRSEARRPYVDDLYGQRFDRATSYREERVHDYDPLPGSKRPYSTMDDLPTPRYADLDVRHSRARLDYDYAGGPHHGDFYGVRPTRSSPGYGSSRSSIANQDSHGLYATRQEMGLPRGSYGSSNVGAIYSSSYGDDCMSRRDVGGTSYSSPYSSRESMRGSSYMGGGPGSYY